MSHGRTGAKYYKSQRYNPEDKPTMYPCEVCGKPVDSDDHATLDVYPSQFLCSDCLLKVIKDKHPEDIIDDFSEL